LGWSWGGWGEAKFAAGSCAYSGKGGTPSLPLTEATEARVTKAVMPVGLNRRPSAAMALSGDAQARLQGGNLVLSRFKLNRPRQ